MALRPTRRVTIASIAFAGGAAILGVFLGAYWLAQISGIPLPGLGGIILLHPRLQIHGFLTAFIMGVAYTLIPWFKNRDLASRPLAYLSVALLIASLLVMLQQSFTQLPELAPALLVSDITYLAAALLFTSNVVVTLGRPRGPMAFTEPYLMASPVLLTASSLMTLAHDLSRPGVPLSFQPGLVQFILLGFPLAMIMGIVLRTSHFRPIQLRRRSAKAAFIPLALGNLLLLPTIAFSLEVLLLVSWVLISVSGLLFVQSIDGLRGTLGRVNLGAMTERDRVRLAYFEPHLRVACGWLILSLLLGLAKGAADLLGTRSFALHDAWIHAFSVGFVSTMIFGYAPILLPSILSRRTPYRGLTTVPLLLLTVGNGLRMLTLILGEVLPVPITPAFLSGLLVLAGVIYFFWMVHGLSEGGRDDLVRLQTS